MSAASASCAFDESADAFCAALTTPANAFGLAASAAKAFGLDMSADITCGFEARALNPGLAASARKFGSWTISSNASVCISSGTAVSPSVTAASVTCAET